MLLNLIFSTISCYKADPVDVSAPSTLEGQYIIIPKGEILYYDCTFPASVIFTNGYMLPDGSIPTMESLTIPADASLSLSAGTVFLGDVIIPPNVTLCQNEINNGQSGLLPGARIITDTIPTTETVIFGIIIPLNKDLPDNDNTYAYIPGGSTITGSLNLTREDIICSPNSYFTNGFEFPSTSGISGEKDNYDSNRGDISCTKSDVNSTEPVLIGSIPPNSFPATITTAVTIPAGSLFLGGMTTDKTQIMKLPSKLTGALLISNDKIIPSPGLALPKGTYLPGGAVIPKGSVLLGNSVFPVGSVITQGYIDTTGKYNSPVTLTASLELVKGTILIGETAIPVITPSSNPEGLPGQLYLSGGTTLTINGLTFPTSTPGIVIPQNYQLNTSSNPNFNNSEINMSRLPNKSLLTGSLSTLTENITLPIGSIIYGGYWDDSAQAFVQTSSSAIENVLALEKNDIIYGGIQLPENSKGIIVATISSTAEIMPLNYVGCIIINSTAEIPAPGMELPARSELLINAKWQAGAVTLLPIDLPVGTLSASGYLLTSTNPPVYNTTKTALTQALTLPAGSAPISEMKIPAGTKVAADKSLFLPSSTKLGEDTLVDKSAGIILPHESTLEVMTTSPYNNITAPAKARFLGYHKPLVNKITFPAGTVFSTGFIKGGANFNGTQATSMAKNSTVSLDTSDILLGTAEIQAEMTIASNVVIAGPVILNSGITQGPGAFILPVNTRILSGITKADANLDGTADTTIAYGDTLTTTKYGVIANQRYCDAVSSFVGAIAGFADFDSAVIECQTDNPTAIEIRYSTTQGFDYLDASKYTAISVTTPATSFYVSISGLSPNTRYYYRAIITDGCADITSENALLTTDYCAEDFQLVAVSGADMLTWNGQFGTAKSIPVMKKEPSTNKLFVGSQKISDGSPDLYSSIDFLSISQTSIPSPTSESTQITAVGTASFGGTNYLYLAYPQQSSKGFILTRADSSNFAGQVLVTPTLTSQSNSDGFGDNTLREVNDMVGGTNFLYLAVGNGRNNGGTINTSGKLFLADGTGVDGGAGLADDFTDNSLTNTNNGAGALRYGGSEILGNSVDSLELFNDTADRLWIGVQNPGGAKLYYAPHNGTPTKALLDNNLGLWDGVGTFSVANTSIEALDAMNGALYMGTENTSGAQLWKCSTNCHQYANWQKVFDFNSVDTSNSAILWVTFNDTKYYFGTYNTTNGSEIWTSTTGNSGSWTQVMGTSCNGDGGFGETIYTNSASAISVTLSPPKPSGDNAIYISFQRYPRHYSIMPTDTGDSRLYRKIE